MATEKYSDKKEEQPTPDNGGSVNGSETTPSQTSDRIQKYIDTNLEGAIKNAASAWTVAGISYNSSLAGRNFNLCVLQQAQAGHAEYNKIRNCISTTLNKRATLIKGNVEAYIAQKVEFGKDLDKALNAIKDVKGKFGELREAACKLDAARNDSCNSEQLNAMKKLPKNTDPDIMKEGIPRFHAEVNRLVERAGKLYERSDDSFEKGVKVSGIQAFMNVGSLAAIVAKLQESAAAFHSLVSGNENYTLEQLSTAQAAFSTSQEELAAALFENNTAGIVYRSLEDSKHKATELKKGLDCPDQEAEDEYYQGLMKDLKEICKNIKGTFKTTVTCSDVTRPGKSG